jgi:hypothetical protein
MGNRGFFPWGKAAGAWSWSVTSFYRQYRENWIYNCTPSYVATVLCLATNQRQLYLTILRKISVHYITTSRYSQNSTHAQEERNFLVAHYGRLFCIHVSLLPWQPATSHHFAANSQPGIFSILRFPVKTIRLRMNDLYNMTERYRHDRIVVFVCVLTFPSCWGGTSNNISSFNFLYLAPAASIHPGAVHR